MKDYIFNVLNDMSEELSIAQLKRLQEVLIKSSEDKENPPQTVDNYEYLNMFINAKRIEGCSARTLTYYENSVKRMLSMIDVPVRKVTTDQIRDYLANYQRRNDCSKTTVDNIRRNISSFFYVA